MEIDFVALAVSIGLTLSGLVITALIWSHAKWRTVIWWLGASLAPIAIFLLGLVPQVIGAWWTLQDWFRGLTFNIVEVIGVGLATTSVGLMFISRVIPAKPRARKPTTQRPVAPVPASPPQVPASQPTPSDDLEEVTEILRRRGIE